MSKRTLDAFFKPTSSQKRTKTEPTSPDPQEHDKPPSNHPTYPFPIPNLPSHIEIGLTHGTPAREPRTITNQPDLDLLYFQPYIPRATANELFKFLRAELPFYRVQYSIKRGGHETTINTPRYTTVFGVDDTSKFIAQPPAPTNPDTSTEPDIPPPPPPPFTAPTLINAEPSPTSPKYQYAPRPIPSCLAHLQSLVEAATGSTYNFCLVNYYASGNDSIAFHSDDERFLGSAPCIASLSLGGEREFLMKHKPDPASGEVVQGAGPVRMPLGSGDMVIMRGATQGSWMHSIPKRKGRGGDAVSGRINITFRRARVKAGTNNYYHYNVGGGGLYRWEEGRRAMVLQHEG